MRAAVGLGIAGVALVAIGIGSGIGCNAIIGLQPGIELCAGVTCPAPADACHMAGTCDPNTGECSNPVAKDGTSCDDGNACTKADACQNGTCTGSAVDCSAADACHAAGTCDPKTGCSNPTADGTPCDDGDKCTQVDACDKGVCTGKNPLDCAAPEPCRLAGTCDPQVGCVRPPADNGTPCDAAVACMTTQGSCQAGICSPAGAMPVADGTSCEDGNVCTANDTCQAGSCNPGGDHTWAHWNLHDPPPSPRFVFTDDVVFDRLTGLTWQRKLVASVKFTWEDAKAHCAAFSTPAFPSGWRLPTRIELASIVDYTRRDPAIDAEAFPGTDINGTFFWTSSSPSQDNVWIVGFGSGYVGIESGIQNTLYSVRCVR
jgi:hypothetical protein